MWTQFVNMQSPMIQSMMSNYIEQSKNLFVQMQENMQNQARSMFTGFPGFPGGEEVAYPSGADDRHERRAADASDVARQPTAPSVGFVSLGCPKALVDSELILTQLRAEGYATSPTYEGADLVIVNTCGFIDAAVQESLDAIGEALAENGKVIVTGCLGARQDRRRREPGGQGASEGAGGHRPARRNRSARPRASASAEAARPVHRSRARRPASSSRRATTRT